MQDRGIPLASNQVQYSLLYRNPERNGVKKACEEGGTTLIAYSPLAQGLLTGDCTHHACWGLRLHKQAGREGMCPSTAAGRAQPDLYPEVPAHPGDSLCGC